MKSKLFISVMMVLFFVSFSQAYLIQGLDLDVEYWAGSGTKECVIAVDWNNTNGPYLSEFHIFGFRWDEDGISGDEDKTVVDALIAIDVAGALDVVTGYGGAFVNDVEYDQMALDGDFHTNAGFTGWWWAGETQDSGQTWVGNAGGIDVEFLWNGGIEGLNIDGTNWGSVNMTIPEPATMAFLAAGILFIRRRK